MFDKTVLGGAAPTERRDGHPHFFCFLCSCQRASEMPFPDLGAEPRGFPANALRCPEAIGRRLVGVPGLEPGTSSLSGTRSNQLSYTPEKGRTPGERVASQAESRTGGAGGIRTPDRLVANQVLWPTELRPRNSLRRGPPSRRAPRMLNSAMMHAS